VELLDMAEPIGLEQARKNDSTLITIALSEDPINSESIAKARTNSQRRVSMKFSRFCGLLRSRKTHTVLERGQSTRIHAPQASSTLIIDVRSKKDFEARHIPDSVSIPLPGIYEGLAGGDLFGDADAVYAICTRMQRWLQGTQLSRILTDAAKNEQKVLLLCYDGFASQLASSAFREKDIEAFTVRGGFHALHSKLQMEEKT
jgi:rhodanese-related sulfurtransferase